MRERTWSSVLCLVFGHSWVGHTAYKLKNDMGRALHGDLCEVCGKFQPRSDGRERFVNPEVTESPYDRSVEAVTDCETVPDWKCANCGNRPRLKFKSEPGNCAHCRSNDWVDDRTQSTGKQQNGGDS